MTYASFRDLTPARVNLLVRSLSRNVPVSGATYRVADYLADNGLGELSHGVFSVTVAGLCALRDYRAALYANGGSMAQLLDLQEVEAALAAEAA